MENLRPAKGRQTPSTDVPAQDSDRLDTDAGMFILEVAGDSTPLSAGADA